LHLSVETTGTFIKAFVGSATHSNLFHILRMIIGHVWYIIFYSGSQWIEKKIALMFKGCVKII